MANDTKQPIIIKKVVKGGGHGHHGGSWKIAYADFVTAMMAFFMLLWLLANTTEEQKQGIADYFSPSTPSLQNSGSDGVLGGQSLDSEGAQNQGSVLLSVPSPQQAAAPQDAAQDSSVQSMIAEREEDRFQMAQEELQTEIEKDPELQDFREHIIVDLTPEGMRIQIVDSEDRPMFKSGTAEPLPYTRSILQEVAKIISNLPNRLRVSGHTDATPFHGPGGYGNWDLSSDRANAARRVLSASGVPPERLYEVTGKAGTEPLFPENPRGAANRRISIVLMREAPVLPPGYVR
jgi:chemotaxis protein MotB